MKNLLLFFCVLGLSLSLVQALPCESNSQCRGGTCFMKTCIPHSKTGGPCDDSGDCLFGNFCDTEGNKCIVPCPGMTNCGTPDNKNCVVIASDPNHCGSCGYTCGANAYCSNGKCFCDTNFGNCDNNYKLDGCESDLLTDKNDCGSCGTDCGINAYCSSAKCACFNGYSNCDENYSLNGCETFIFANDFCGTCASHSVCGGSGSRRAICRSGSCACSDSAYTNPDGDYSNGCEGNAPR